MICYQDRSFCSSPGCRDKCGRRATMEVRAAARAADLPLSLARFCDDEGELLTLKPQTPSERVVAAALRFYRAEEMYEYAKSNGDCIVHPDHDNCYTVECDNAREALMLACEELERGK